ncbi:hypothetical protein ASG29_02075 [Sphingomonas sp. Leaf412]|nr:hypothetical protein ASG29_02075 [Sphingomonas sp. Leaf412]
MPRAALVLRPEPGAAATLARLAAAGIRATAVPLFRIAPVAWSRPAGTFDALLLTSANALRHGGDALDAVRDLPVVAVGAATARAAGDAGFAVVATGMSDAAGAIAAAAAWPRLLHLAGRERVAMRGVTAVTVYAADPLALPDGALAAAVDGVVLLHSPRAAARFAALSQGLPRDRIRIAALSDAVARAAGTGWARIAVAPHPDDAALAAVAASLAIDP